MSIFWSLANYNVIKYRLIPFYLASRDLVGPEHLSLKVQNIEFKINVP